MLQQKAWSRGVRDDQTRFYNRKERLKNWSENHELFNAMTKEEQEMALKTLVLTVWGKQSKYSYLVLDEQLKTAFQILYDDTIKVGWGNTRFFFKTNLKSFKVTYNVSSLQPWSRWP